MGPKRRIAAVFALGAVVVTCAKQEPVKQQPAKPLPVASATAAPVPVQASAAPSSPAAPTLAPAPPAKRPAASPGTIWCEEKQCDLASEVCCIIEKSGGVVESHCAARAGAGPNPCCPKGNAFCGNEGFTLQRSCDEAADCPNDERCCVLDAGEGDLTRQWCTEGCWDEVCVSGAKCFNGNVCECQDGEQVGRCPMQILPPECGGVTCKMGETCCWDSKGRRGTCAEKCGEGVDYAFECTAPEQCAPFDCNSYAGEANPWRYYCGGGGFTSGVLCKSLSDCPKHSPSLGSGPWAPTVKRCAHERELPRGVKECQWE